MSDPVALLSLPAVFTQDGLFAIDEFVKEAKKVGFEVVTAGMLEALHRSGHLAPLIVSVRGEDPAQVVEIDSTADRCFRQDAAAGRLRDPAVGTAPDEVLQRWYSYWQLLELAELPQTIARLDATKRVSREDYSSDYDEPAAADADAVQRIRTRTIALCALATPLLPGITHRVKRYFPHGREWLYEAMRGYDARQALEHCGVGPERLKSLADTLLFRASRDDPLQEWLELVRYASPDMQDKLRGSALLSIWQRRAAEVLIRGHEEIFGPLEDEPGRRYHNFHDERITTGGVWQRPLATTLVSFGLSPQPRVLLLVEGQTEFLHVRGLLKLLKLPPSFIDVEHLSGADNTPYGIARYVGAPRLGPKRFDGRELVVPPTVLWILADPEGLWAPRRKTLSKVKQQLREQVELQDGSISDEELDYLVHAEIAGRGFYEVNNFDTDELVDALRTCARNSHHSDVEAPEWERQVRADLAIVNGGASSAYRHVVLKNASPPHHTITKIEMAEALFPLLQQDIEAGEMAKRPILASLSQIIAFAGARVPRHGTVVLKSP
jgi:hypothetical protein